MIAPTSPESALKFEAEVQENGQVVLAVPYPRGTRVLVFVVQESNDDFADLTAAAQTSIAFWDNPYDDEDWNEDASDARAR